MLPKFKQYYDLITEMPHVRLSDDTNIDLTLEQVPAGDIKALRSHVIQQLQQTSDPRQALLDIAQNELVAKVLNVRFNLTAQQFIKLISQ